MIPSAAFSGMLSIMEPMNNDFPEVEFFLSMAILSLPSDLFVYPIFELLDFDFLSKMEFAIL